MILASSFLRTEAVGGFEDGLVVVDLVDEVVAVVDEVTEADTVVVDVVAITHITKQRRQSRVEEGFLGTEDPRSAGDLIDDNLRTVRYNYLG